MTIASTPPTSAIRSRAASQEMPGSPSPSSAQNRRRTASPAGPMPGQRADPAAELADQPARRALAQPVEVPADLVGPAGRLPAERDRRAGLPVGPSGEDGVAVPLSEVEQQLLDAMQIAPDLAADGAQGQ